MKPVIGISTNYLTVESGKFLGMERVYVNKDYVDAVIKSGGIPLLLPPVDDSQTVVETVSLCNGFILSGGGDINPLFFNCPPHPQLGDVHTQLDYAQLSLAKEILKQKKPLLAICRGTQLLNVALGGSLYQDLSEIGTPVMQHSQIAPRADNIHEIFIKDNSRLSELFGNKIMVNSFHHQSIWETGKGLQITAQTADGVIEAVELPDYPFVVGVQWHPEMQLTQSDEMLSLFQSFIASCGC